MEKRPLSLLGQLLVILVIALAHCKPAAAQQIVLPSTAANCFEGFGVATLTCGFSNALCSRAQSQQASTTAGGQCVAGGTSDTPTLAIELSLGSWEAFTCSSDLTVNYYNNQCYDATTPYFQITFGTSLADVLSLLGGGDAGCLGGGIGGPPHNGNNVPDCSPIILDTDGKGFQLTSAKDGVLFDISGKGHPIQIAWTASGSTNGFLVLDRNGNGRIDNGTELFGNFTQQPVSSTPNGFLALAEFDKPENGGNGDGIIDAKDQVFSRLMVWIDSNHNGISDPGELHSLSSLGITAFSLNYKESRKTDTFGNVFRFKAKVNPTDRGDQPEGGRWAFDVFLATH